MDSLGVIFEISSDDEDELCCNEPDVDDDYDWLSEVLKSVDKPPEDDSDDVVVVSEVHHRKRARLSKPVENDFDDGGDDCVILDGDPEKSDGGVNEAETETESDDLLIVGEKGQALDHETEMSCSYKSIHQMMVTRQVACRDFPHSRQHCVKFPFNSTPHERHCNLCHCYVCDSIAPCKYWGKGISNYDHCHAIEKEERWKLQRENRKNQERPPPSVPKFPYASHSMSQPQNQVRRCSQVADHNNVPPSTVVQNQVSRPTVIRACTSSAYNPVVQNQVSRPALVRTSIGTPRVKSHAKRYLADQFLARNRNHHHLISQPPSNDFIQKERDHSIGRPGARYTYIPPQRTYQRYPLKHTSRGRSGIFGTSTSMNQRSGTFPGQNMFPNTAPSQPSQSNVDQNIYHTIDQTENGRNPTFPESQIQDNRQSPVDNLPLPASCSQALPEFEIEKWLLDNDTLQDGLEAPADAGTIDFDFEKWLLGNE